MVLFITTTQRRTKPIVKHFWTFTRKLNMVQYMLHSGAGTLIRGGIKSVQMAL